MKVDDIVLMAYVDGELSPEERQQVENELRTHAELADQLALFTASRLPYREAFAQQALPPVPESLSKRVDDLLRAHADAAERAARDADTHSANDTSIPPDSRVPPSAPVRSRLRVAPTWLAVAFVAGAFICGVTLRLAPGIGIGGTNNSATVASSTMGNLPWVQVAASYQQLYSRDTVAHAWPDQAAAARTVDDIRREDGIALRVPDLSKAGLKFVGVQRLRFHNRPLVQIVYLPEKGEPVALCVIKEAKPDQTVAARRIDDMNVVTWRQSELGYALIGASGNGDITPLGKEIADRQFDPLFGSV